MYVFDADNDCVGSGVLSEEEVANRTAVLPPLDPGDYRIVCLANTHHTEVDNLDCRRFDQMRFACRGLALQERWSPATIRSITLPHPIRLSRTMPGREDRTQVVGFASSHYKVSVEVAGVPASGQRADGTLVLELCNVSPCTDFENRACGEATTYRLESKYDVGRALLTAVPTLCAIKTTRTWRFACGGFGR